MADVTELIRQFGPWLAFVVYFIWQSWIRESKQNDQLIEAHKFVREKMTCTIDANTHALQQLTNMIENKDFCLYRGNDHV